MFLFLQLLLLVFTASQLQLKRMFKKDSVKKTEHLEVQGMELELTRHPLGGGGGGLERIPGASGGSQSTCDHAIFYCANIRVNFNTSYDFRRNILVWYRGRFLKETAFTAQAVHGAQLLKMWLFLSSLIR